MKQEKNINIKNIIFHKEYKMNVGELLSHHNSISSQLKHKNQKYSFTLKKLYLAFVGIFEYNIYIIKTSHLCTLLFL